MQGADRWVLLDDAGAALAVGHGAAVQHQLEQALHDPSTGGRLRDLAAGLAEGTELWRYDDQQVLDLLTAALESGRLRLRLRAPPVLLPLVPQRGTPAGAPPPPAAGRSRDAASAGPAALADTMFGPDFDLAAMVDSLQRAARDGVPFCEECTRVAEPAAAGAT